MTPQEHFQPWPMFCAHLVVVTLMLAAVGPATGMPHLLATGLLAMALVALCSPVPPVIAVGLAVGCGVVLEVSYSAGAMDPVVLGSSIRLLLLTGLAFGVVALRRRKLGGMLRMRQEMPGDR